MFPWLFPRNLCQAVLPGRDPQRQHLRAVCPRGKVVGHAQGSTAEELSKEPWALGVWFLQLELKHNTALPRFLVGYLLTPPGWLVWRRQTAELWGGSLALVGLCLDFCRH